MSTDKEYWIRNVMDSLDGLQRAEPNPFLYAKIRDRLGAASQADRPPVRYVRARTAWLAAATFAGLLLLNWQVWRSTVASSAPNELSTVVSGLHLYATPPGLY